MSKQYVIKSVFRGKTAHRYGLETAIDKFPAEASLYLSSEGLEGDQCSDQRHHGGPERALHQYPSEHYAYWREEYGADYNWRPPGMGENLSSEGMTEQTVCLGDRYQWGDAVIEVSQPRSPCFKLNKRWDIESFSVDMQDIGRCGWLYRIIKPGMVSAGASLELIERVPNSMTLSEVCDVFFGDPLNREGLLKLKSQSRLSDTWMSKVLDRLDTNEVENWSFRLLGRQS